MPFMCCLSTGFHDSVNADELGTAPVRLEGERLGAKRKETLGN